MKKFLIAAASIVLMAGGCVNAPAPAPAPVPTPTPTPTPAPQPVPDPHGPAAKANLIVSDIAPGAQVSSPLIVTGRARGTWYFEASFPVHLYDANGAQLAVLPAQAQGEWMTEDFVPFAVTLTYPTPATATGTLILRKDNPSGEPQFDDYLAIPVVF